MKQVLFLCVVFFATIYAQTPQVFEADISIYNDPAVHGILTGHIFYDYTDSQYRINYAIGVVELIDYSSRLRYLYCTSTCDTETFNSPMPIYYKAATDTAAAGGPVTVGTRSCTGWNHASPASGQVQTVYIDSSNLVCRVVYVGGKTIDFTNVAALSSTGVFLAYQGWNCPQPQCSKQIDFMLIFDESGSIDPTSFTAEKNFGVNIARSYTFGPQYVAMGAVWFSTSARLISPLTVVQQSFINAIQTSNPVGQSTCLGCGLQLASQEITRNGRPGVSKVFIFLTDGRNNVQTSTFSTVLAQVKSTGVIIFAIGVAQAVASEIQAIASSIPGVQTAFFTPDFSQLSSILNSLIIATCIDIPGTPCGAGCFGFCACGATCVCPNQCDNTNKCTRSTCTPGQGGNGCTSSPVVCNDNNQCTTDTCVTATGCVYTNISCDDQNPCTNDNCIPSVGCQHVATDCNDNNPCTQDACDPAGAGCTHTAISCDKCLNPSPVVCAPIPCKTSQCDPNTGTCVSTDINCNDNNLCSTKSCNPTSGLCEYVPIVCDDGNACTHDGCNPTTGCVYTPFNISNDCNDFNVCTNDTCDVTQGCQHTQIVCDDKDPCTQNLCNSALGCNYPVVDCGQDPTVKQYISNCYQALCATAQNGCFLQQIDGTTVDQCHVCNGDGSTCVGLQTTEAIGLSAGLLAVIIIAAVVVCAALGIFGGKKGYDIWLKNRPNMQTAAKSPIYEDNGLSGTNPLFKK